MSLAIVHHDISGRTLFATITQLSASGVLGDVWDVTNTQWAPNPATADRKITMTEGSSPNLGRYSGGVSYSLQTYTGRAVVSIHDDDDADTIYGSAEVYISNGVEVRFATTADADTGAEVYSYIEGQGGVTASNMRGTDSALLAAGYTAPDNTGIGNALTQATTAATQSTTAATQASAAAADAALVEGRLTLARAGNLDNLDAAITTRSSHAALDVHTAIEGQGGVTASNMRGTDNAFLAASWVAPDNTGIGVAETAALAAQTAAESTNTRLTAVRAGYLDNLSAGAVATQASVDVIGNTTRTKFFGPAEQQIPAAGSTVIRFNLMLFDTAGNMEAPDSLPTVAAANASGLDRSANLGTVTLVSVGHYRVDYTISNTHAEEQITLTATVTEGGATLKDAAVTNVVALVSGSGFTSGDRSQLVAIYNKLPSKSYLAGTAAADGDLNLDEQDGDKGAFKADVSALATSANVAAVPANTHTYINANGGVTSSNMRGTDSALLAAGYTAPDNTGIGNALTQATTAATQSTTAATQATAAAADAATIEARLTALRAGYLDNLSAGAVAQEATLTGLSLAGGINVAGAPLIDIPTAGTDTYRYYLVFRDKAGNLANPDATPTVTAWNQEDTTRSANLGTVINVSTGVYRVDYSVASTHAAESITLRVQWQISAASRSEYFTFAVHDPLNTSDIPSAAAIASQVDSTLTTSHGAGAWNTASDATLANQTTIIAAVGAIGGVVTPSSVVDVASSRTWIFQPGSEDALAANIVMVAAGSTVTLAMDLTEVINPGTSILTVASADDISGNALATSDLAPSQDGKKAHFKVSPTVAGARHEMKVTVTTSDGQTLVRHGILRVE